MEPVEQPAGQEPAEAPTGQEPSGGTQQEVFDAAYVKQLREEAASWRRKVKDLEGKVTGFETEKLSEAERLKAEAKTAKAEAKAAQEALRKARADVVITQAAAQHQIDPKLLGRLVEVQFDDDGNPAGVDEAIAGVLKDYPYLKAGGVSLSSTNPQRKAALTLADVAKMTEAEINARWPEVQEAMKAGK